MTATKKPVNENNDSYPKSVFFIISNEFCERFSYYGMRTILIIYLTQILFYGPNEATVIFHAFTIACYFTPVLGAIISDSYLGKFKTILYISFIYAAGNVMISYGSVPQANETMKLLSLIGLGLIALGTGGIKPCVSAFGGDQFKPGQERYRERFFSYFYLSINLGSMFSTFITPILRNDIHCFGSLSCFPVAFGVPAALMIVAIVIFVFGKPLYKINPPGGDVLSKFIKCIFHALSRKLRANKAKVTKKEHWLEYADDKYDAKFIREVQTVLHILLLFIPLPVFWALFDQQGSRWTLQATHMSGKMFGWTMQPDQMQVVNPVLIVILIPSFEYIIYPMLNKCNLLKKPLQRIVTGGLIASSAFIIAGFLQLKLEENYPVFPHWGMSKVITINNSPCNISINTLSMNETMLGPFEKFTESDIKLGKLQDWNLRSESCSENVVPTEFTFNSTHPIESMMITTVNGELKAMNFEDTLQKSGKGYAMVRIFYNFNPQKEMNNTVTFLLQGKTDRPFNPKNNLTYGATDYIDIPSDEYKLFLIEKPSGEKFLLKELEVGEGGNYIISLYEDPKNSNAFSVHTHTLVVPNTVSLMLQLPQYILITVAEIMFSVTGLEFSYSQAPQSMKSVLQAAWLLTVSFGNLIVLVIAELEIFNKQSYEFFLFAVLMAADMFIFGIMARLYKYVKPEETEKEPSASPPSEPPPYDEANYHGGKLNLGYDEDTKF